MKIFICTSEKNCHQKKHKLFFLNFFCVSINVPLNILQVVVATYEVTQHKIIMSSNSNTPEALAAASLKAFLLLDRKGKGIVTRVDAILSLQTMTQEQIQEKAPKMEHWLQALANPRTFANIFDAMNTSKLSNHLTLEEFTAFVQEQEDIQTRERLEAEQCLKDEKEKENNAATKISSIIRGRSDRQRVVEVRQRKNSAVVIQNQFRMKDARKQVRGKRIEIKRESHKAKKREKYRQEMKDRKAEMNSRYATKRKGSMSPGQLHKASERTKKRALAIRRKKKVEEEAKKKKDEEARNKKKEQLSMIPGFGRQKRSRASISNKSIKSNNSTQSSLEPTTITNVALTPIITKKPKKSPASRNSKIPRRLVASTDTTVTATYTSPLPTVRPPFVVRSPATSPLSSSLKSSSQKSPSKSRDKRDNIRDSRIVVKAYTMGVAFGRQGIGYRLSINRNASWSSVLEKLESKFDQRGDVGAVGIVRDEDGCEIQDTSELVENDRIFVCRIGEKWGGTGMQDKENNNDGAVDLNLEEEEKKKDLQLSVSKNGVTWAASSTFEAPFFRDMRSSDATATIFETRENETLAVTSVGGVGRLVVT